MKTYKQKHESLVSKNRQLHDRIWELTQENNARKSALESATGTYDPVEFLKLVKIVELALEGLEAIKAIAPVGSEAKIIATEVLLQIGKDE
jgi:hypothetical protein